MTSGRRPAVIGAWLASDVVSLFGSRVAALAVPWFVLTSTGSAALTGTVGAVQLAAMVVTRFLAGPLIDRIGPARTAVAGDAASSLVIALIPALSAAGDLGIAPLIGIVAVVGSLRGPADSAKGVLVAPLAAATGQPLERMTGLASTTERLASTIGMAVGGLIVAAIGGPMSLVLTACGLTVSAVITCLVVSPAITSCPAGPPDPQCATGSSSYRCELLADWAFIHRTPVLLGLVLIPAMTNMLDTAWSEVLVPAWTLRHGGDARILGYLFASLTVAAVAGSALTTAFASRLPRVPAYLFGWLLAGAPRFLVMAGDAGIGWVIVTHVVAGFGAGFINPVIGAIQFERTPEHLRGRVLSTSGALAWSLMPVGSLLGGVATAHAGLPLTLALTGLMYLAVTMLPTVIPSWRDFERPGEVAGRSTRHRGWCRRAPRLRRTPDAGSNSPASPPPR